MVGLGIVLYVNEGQHTEHTCYDLGSMETMTHSLLVSLRSTRESLMCRCYYVHVCGGAGRSGCHRREKKKRRKRKKDESRRLRDDRYHM
jgi:hypothetical protein